MRDLVVHQFFRGVGLGGGADDFFLRGLGLFHQDDFRVLDFDDRRPCHFDFVGERPVFLILARLQLLVGVFFDLRFFGLDFEFALLAFGLDLLDAAFGGFQLALGGGGAGAERFAFRADVGQFLGDAEDFPVAILQNEQVSR